MEKYGKMSENTESEIEFDKIDRKNYAAAIKCIFSKPKTIGGAFCILLRKHDSKMIELVLWTTRSAPNNDEAAPIPSMTWEDFSTKIPSIGPIDKESCEKLKYALKEKLSKDVIDNLFKGYESNVISFTSEVRELFETTLHYLIQLDLEFEPFNQERLKSSGYERDEVPPDTSTEGVTMSQIIAEHIDAQIVNCNAVVDPVNGIAASHLKEGDIVEVVIQTNSTVGALLSDHYAKLNQTPEFPVQNVSISDSGSYVINLIGGEGISCVVKTSSDLKMRAKKGYAYGSPVSGRNVMIVAGFFVTVLVLGVIALIRLLLR